MEIDLFALFVAIPVVALVVTFVLTAYEEETSEADQIHRGDWSRALKLSSPMQWVTTIALTILFLITGIHIVTGLPEVGAVEVVLSRFEAWGYSHDFRLFVGFTEILAAFLLIPPQTSSWSAGYLGILMVGSVYTHLAVGTWALALVPLLFLVALTYLMVARAPWALGAQAGWRERPT